MKKLSLLALLVILFTACSENKVVGPNTFTQKYRIYAEEMVKKTDLAGTYYEYSIHEPRLTNEVFDNGILQAFLYYTKDGKDTMTPLPHSDFLGNTSYQWQEQFTVEFQPGTIRFIQKISDHTEDSPVSDYYDILVRFLW